MAYNYVVLKEGKHSRHKRLKKFKVYFLSKGILKERGTHKTGCKTTEEFYGMKKNVRKFFQKPNIKFVTIGNQFELVID